MKVEPTDDGRKPGVYVAQQLKQMPARQYMDEMLAPALYEGLRLVLRDRCSLTLVAAPARLRDY